MFLLIILFSFPEFNKSVVTLRIINTKIRDNEKITFQIKNNSKINYCFVLDTVSPIRSHDYYHNLSVFVNPKLIIYDSQNKVNSIWIKDVTFDQDALTKTNLNIYGDNQMSVKEDKFALIFVKANTSMVLNMPLNLIVRENDETIIYYKLNDNEKYKCKIEYSIKQEFIKNRISNSVMDSIKKKGYRFFTGKLASNKVSLER